MGWWVGSRHNIELQYGYVIIFILCQGPLSVHHLLNLNVCGVGRRAEDGDEADDPHPIPPPGYDISSYLSGLALPLDRVNVRVQPCLVLRSQGAGTRGSDPAGRHTANHTEEPMDPDIPAPELDVLHISCLGQ